MRYDYALSNLTGRNIVVGKGLSRLFQLAALFAELILPFGLLFKKTRKWAALLLLAFHFYLAFTVFADFSALAVFLLLACIVDFNEKTPNAKTIRGLRLYIGFAVASVLMAPLLPKIGIAPYHFSFAHGLVYNIGLLSLLIPVFRNYRPSAQGVQKSHYPALIGLVLLISLWSLKTYLGLGNAGNLTMFSNLLTEKSRSNHLLIDTQKTKLFGFEEDNLLVLELHPKLKPQKLEHYKLPVIEFKYQVSRWVLKYPSVKLNCKLVYKGDTIAIADLRHSEFSKAKWWYRYVNFRKIQPEGPNGCYW